MQIVRVNIGCGQTPTPGWINFDNSPTVKIAKNPLINFLLNRIGILGPEHKRFINIVKKANIQWADAAKKIPLENNSVDVVYSSHMLEHLDREEAQTFLKECLRILKPGGIVRLVVPDLEKLVIDYINNRDADLFIQRTLLAYTKPKTLKQKLLQLIVGYRGHCWMYDGESLKKLLHNAGFVKVNILPPGKTMIEKPGNLNLYEREKESVYVEGFKP